VVLFWRLDLFDGLACLLEVAFGDQMLYIVDPENWTAG
jgi:hypothetical protein